VGELKEIKDFLQYNHGAARLPFLFIRFVSKASFMTRLAQTIAVVSLRLPVWGS
jgi:hypothetical protein